MIKHGDSCWATDYCVPEAIKHGDFLSLTNCVSFRVLTNRVLTPSNGNRAKNMVCGQKEWRLNQWSLD